MNWHREPFAAFDTETTGVDTASDRIVTAAIVVIDGTLVEESTWLVDPGIDIPAEASAIHGITTEKAREDGVAAHLAVPEIGAMLASLWALGMPIVAMNASFDLTILTHELSRHGEPPLVVGNVIDPLVIDRGVDRYRRGKRTLTALCETYGVKQGEAHNAAGDCLSVARVAWTLAERYPDSVAIDLGELQQWQAEAHAEWAQHFEAYLRGKGDSDVVISRDWPIGTAP